MITTLYNQITGFVSRIVYNKAIYEVVKYKERNDTSTNKKSNLLIRVDQSQNESTAFLAEFK